MFEFLSDLRNHWRLEPHFLELEQVGPTGGRVRIKGPLGLSRVARTAVASTERPRRVSGTAELGGGTLGHVRWDIRALPVPGRSHVTLSALVERASLLDRVLLACGGRWWLRRIVGAAVRRLGTSISNT